METTTGFASLLKGILNWCRMPIASIRATVTNPQNLPIAKHADDLGWSIAHHKKMKGFLSKMSVMYLILFIFAPCGRIQIELCTYFKDCLGSWAEGKNKVHYRLFNSIVNCLKLSCSFVDHINVQNTCWYFVHKYIEILALVSACLFISLFLKVGLKNWTKIEKVSRSWWKTKLVWNISSNSPN